MTPNKRICELIVKRLRGNLTSKEGKELRNFSQESEENKRFLDRLSPAAFHKMSSSEKIEKITKLKIGDIPDVLD